MTQKELKEFRTNEIKKVLNDNKINVIELLIFDICLYEHFNNNQEFIDYLKGISEDSWELLLKRLLEYCLFVYIPSDNFTFFKFVYSGILQNKIIYFKSI